MDEMLKHRNTLGANKKNLVLSPGQRNAHGSNSAMKAMNRTVAHAENFGAHGRLQPITESADGHSKNKFLDRSMIPYPKPSQQLRQNLRNKKKDSSVVLMMSNMMTKRGKTKRGKSKPQSETGNGRNS